MKYLISHRGNIDGKKPNLENNLDYIYKAISLGYDVEIDVWFINGDIYLGHDKPQYIVELDWIHKLRKRLWIHCKNLDTVVYFHGKKYNYFFHDTDDCTITSQGNIWVYPGKQPVKNSIAVLPELFNDDVEGCLGVCSDFIKNYK